MKILHLQYNPKGGQANEEVKKILEGIQGAEVKTYDDLSADFWEGDFDVLVVEVEPLILGAATTRERYIDNLANVGYWRKIVAIRTDGNPLVVSGAFRTLPVSLAKNDLTKTVEAVFAMNAQGLL